MPSLSCLSIRSLLLVYVVDTEGFVLKKYIGVGMVLPVALTELERRCLQAGSPSRRAIIAVCGIGQHGERGGHLFSCEKIKRAFLPGNKPIFSCVMKMEIRSRGLPLICLPKPCHNFMPFP